MLIIGLTGGIASGKSTASAVLKGLGASIIDADRIAREIVLPGQPALSEISDAFGQDILMSDGTLDRRALARIVFNCPEKLECLNRITHPRIVRRIQEALEQCRGSAPVAVVDAALLVELNLTDLVDEVWLLCVSPDVQLQRLKAREGIGETDAGKIIGAQMPQEEKKKKVHVCIDNDGTPEELEKQIRRLWQQRTEHHG